MIMYTLYANKRGGIGNAKFGIATLVYNADLLLVGLSQLSLENQKYLPGVLRAPSPG
jgi:hypothetical protein